MTGCFLRFTPTGVGTIESHNIVHTFPPVHPHGRGDNPVALSDSVAVVGSPPRAWGQSDGDDLSWDGSRFTPTGVGTMSGCRSH